MDKKYIILVVGLAVIIIVLFGILTFVQKGNPAVVDIAPITPVEISGIQIIAPLKDAVVFSPLHIEGTTNGGGWIGFEGQVGTVQLLDSAGNELAVGILTATTDWMTSPVSFAVDVIFAPPAGGAGTLVFHNENPSGDPEKDKTFILPIKF